MTAIAITTEDVGAKKPRSAEMFPGPGFRIRTEINRLDPASCRNSRTSQLPIFRICSTGLCRGSQHCLSYRTDSVDQLAP